MLNFSCLPTDTIADLKHKIWKEEGVVPSSQTLFCEFMKLEADDDQVLLSDLAYSHLHLAVPLDQPQVRLPLELPAAARHRSHKIVTEKDTWIVTGSRKDFQCMKITANTVENIRPPKGKFGIVTHTEGTRNGEKNYTVRRYKEERDGKLYLRVEENTIQVYLQHGEGQSTTQELLEGVMMSYEESRRSRDSFSETLRILLTDVQHIVAQGIATVFLILATTILN